MQAIQCASRRSLHAIGLPLAHPFVQGSFSSGVTSLPQGRTTSIAPMRTCKHVKTHSLRPSSLVVTSRRSIRTCALSRSTTNTKVEELISACEGTGRGVGTSAQQYETIMKLVDELKEAQKGKRVTPDDIDACWTLLWTTEKETLFILKRAPLFGTTAGASYQIINSKESWLQNVITFPPYGAFIVDSTTSYDGSQRTQFQFTAATLKLPWSKWQLPPYGKGWFDTVYVDETIRIASDSRGDTLIVMRDGPPIQYR